MPQPIPRWLRVAPVASLPWILIASACADPAKGAPFAYHESSILGTSLELLITAPSQADADKAHTVILDEIQRLNKILSTYQADAELARINTSRQPVKASPELLKVLKLYDTWQRRSNGAFSGNLGSIVALWKQAAGDAGGGKLPDRDKLLALAADAKSPLWKIDDAAGTVTRLSDQTINVDSLGKGFITSRAATLAKAKVPAVRGILLNIGGDITVIGTANIDKIEPWTIGIADPAHPDENSAPLTEVKLTSHAIATSGGYERAYKVGAKRFSHLIDPRTGWPIDPADPAAVASATVIASDNATANALAASLCVLKPAEGLAIIRTLPGTQALIVLGDGKQIRSPGFAQYETTKPTSPISSGTPSTPATPSAPTTPSTPAAPLAQNAWPKNFVVNLPLQLISVNRNRPYLAVWIEDSSGKPVNTLAIWGNEPKYIRSLSTFWKFGKNDNTLVKSISRATRPVGQYAFTWDGTDQSGKPVPQGTYTLWVETAIEHAGHQQKSTTIVCGPDKSTATLAATPHFEEATLTYAPKGAAQ